MKKEVIGLAIFVGGLYVAIVSYAWLGILLVLLGVGVLNGSRHEVWFSMDLGSGTDDGDGGGGDGGGD